MSKTMLDFTQKQVHAIVASMLAVARVDKVQPAERQMIREFYDAARHQFPKLESFSDLAKAKFDLAKVKREIGDNTDVAKLLVESCLMAAFADGQYSAGERSLTADVAKAVGVMPKALARMEESVADILLSQLAHVQNTDALLQVRKELVTD